jgi:hypothetical protein
MVFLYFHLRFGETEAPFFIYFFFFGEMDEPFFFLPDQKMEVETERKTFPRLSELFNRPGANLIKPFLPVIYDFLY